MKWSMSKDFFFSILCSKLTTFAGSSSSLLNHHVKSKHRDIIPQRETSAKSEVMEVDVVGIHPTSVQETKSEVKSDTVEPSGHDESKDTLVNESQMPKFKTGPIPKAWLPDGSSQILRLYVFGPSGLRDYGSATLRCKI